MRLNMFARTAALLGFVAPVGVGCFNPDETQSETGASTTGQAGTTDSDDGVATVGSTVGTDSTTSAGSDAGSDAAGDSRGASSDGGNAETLDTDHGGSSGGPPAEVLCEDGIVVPGEVCFESFREISGASFAFGFLEDIDLDGDADLVYSATNGELFVEFNADGEFGLPTSSNFAGVSSLDNAGFTDFNDDNVLDAILVSESGGVFYSTAGNTSGDYAIAAGQTTEAYGIAMGDMDGNGDLEAVVMVLAGLQVYDIDSAGMISQLDAVDVGGNAGGLDFGNQLDIELADLNDDEQLDVIYLGDYEQDNSQVRIQLGTGTGTLSNVELFPVMTTTAASDLAIGDFDGDSELDIAVGDGGAVGVVFGNGALGFTEIEDIVLASGNASEVEAVDVDSDGIDDIVVGYQDREFLTVLRGSSDRVFSDGEDIGLAHRTETLRTGDVNGDSVPDLVITSRADNALTVVRSTN